MTQGPIHYAPTSAAPFPSVCGLPDPAIVSPTLDHVTCEDCLIVAKAASSHDHPLQNARIPMGELEIALREGWPLCKAALTDDEAFCYVTLPDCIGGLDGAKARATRIAEALNCEQHQFERQTGGGPGAWELNFPSERERLQGCPQYRLTITGHTWADVREAFKHCEAMTQPKDQTND